MRRGNSGVLPVHNGDLMAEKHIWLRTSGTLMPVTMTRLTPFRPDGAKNCLRKKGILVAQNFSKILSHISHLFYENPELSRRLRFINRSVETLRLTLRTERDACLLVDKLDQHELDAALSYLDDPVNRGHMINKGFAQASKFSWNKCAEETAAKGILLAQNFSKLLSHISHLFYGNPELSRRLRFINPSVETLRLTLQTERSIFWGHLSQDSLLKTQSSIL
jgi:hypothetical protein